jgi:hypothetical protein
MGTDSKSRRTNPKLTALNAELAQVEAGIEKLLDTLSGANATLLSYANGKIEEIDAHRQGLVNEIAALTATAVSPARVERLSGYLDDWENVNFEDKRQITNELITQIRATGERKKSNGKSDAFSKQHVALRSVCFYQTLLTSFDSKRSIIDTYR